MLPYASIPEAAAALGRNLTFAETLWFNYSAAKSNYFLYCHNILFLFLFLVFSLVPLPLVFLEFKRFSFVSSHKIQPKVHLSLTETFKCYKDIMHMFFLVVGPFQLISYPSIQRITPITGSIGFCTTIGGTRRFTASTMSTMHPLDSSRPMLTGSRS
ncbi:methylsterol monooxygenase 1-1-like [Glycine soja]|uniref:methylsterol monooxygenase 1-1-like n=1 Tax=Glycine soja TaxID=3848 RepID=UPI00104056FA|nr:methylsterol monooxygenase 1-1-like [Glycine soja]